MLTARTQPGRRVGYSHVVRARAAVPRRKVGAGSGRVGVGSEGKGVKRRRSLVKPPKKREASARVKRRAP